MKECNDLLLSLNDNVYIVKGKCYSCIYDFNTLKLYRINARLYNLLNEINCKDRLLESFSQVEKEIINKMIKSNLLKLCNVRKKNSVDDLIEENNIQFVWIEVTKKCNLRCVHCYNESEIKCKEEMSMEDFMETIDSILKLNVKKIQIIGGEPFIIGNKLRKMLDYIIGKFEFIEIFTNGTLITDEWVNYIKDNNIKVALSVYSYNENEHDKVTQCIGSWKKTNEIIQKLKGNGIKYRVCNIIMKDIDLGEKNTSLYTLNPQKDLVRMSGRGNLSLLSNDQIESKLITKRTFEIPLNKRRFIKSISGHNCFGNKLYIAVDKTIYPCVMERRIKHGIINGDNGIVLNKDILKLNKDCIEECKECEYRYACFDCRSDSLVEDVYKKPWYCTYQPNTGIWEDTEIFINKLLSDETIR